jgi:HEAT repeat protein
MKDLALSILLLLSLPALATARADVEQDLLRILRSAASPVEKADAAARLRSVGTAQAVPALAALLHDQETAHAARHALEGIPAAEAGDALRQALVNSMYSSGGLRFSDPAGLIDSLGWRGEAESVSWLPPFLLGTEPAASAAATALGRIGNDEALAALEGALDKVKPETRPAVCEGLLRCADRQIQIGQRIRAIAIYRSLFDTSDLEPVRTAAYAGLIRCADDRGFDLIVAALDGDDVAAVHAALPLAVNLSHPGATEAFIRLLPETSRTRQVALLALLESRGDRTALPAIATAARSQYPEVRAGAIAAMGALGDASCIDLLIEAATSPDAVAQTAARQALTVLRGDEVTAALTIALGSAKSDAQTEIARALSARADSAAVPALLDLVGNGESASLRAAIQALGQLVDGSHMNSLIRLLIDSKTQSARDQIRGLFQSLVDRSPDPRQLDLRPILDGLTGGITEVRLALLPVSVLFIDDRIHAAVRSALQDSNAAVRDAAARALCESSDPALLPDMIALARQAMDPGLRSLAIHGSLRLATDNEIALAKQQRIHALTEIFPLGNRPEDRRRILSGLARVPDASTLRLAEQACAEPAVRPEAELACLQIARALGSSEFDVVQASLARLGAGAADPNVRSNALAVLKQLDSGWLCAGPYRVPGKQAQDLFDVGFAPESRDAGDVVWRRAPGSLDLARPGEVDLSGITEGDHCVVYAKTQVYVPSAQDVVLAIGSDDGIKLWLNGELVHGNNAVRGLTPGQDRARARLLEGWNDLLAKITQHTLGCGMMIRITDPTDTEIPGLRWRAP